MPRELTSLSIILLFVGILFIMRLPFFQSKKVNYSALSVSTEASSSKYDDDESKMPKEERFLSPRATSSTGVLFCHLLLTISGITLTVSWFPTHCREDELMAEFDRAGSNGSWPYYADKNATVPMTVEEISLLADLPRDQAVFYTSTEWHIARCAFYWRKEFRMRAKGLMTEKRYDKESHIEHCYEIFMSRDRLHEINVASPV